MGKRTGQGALPRAPAEPTLAREGRFRIQHDAASPHEWLLVLEGADATAAWMVERGVPPRPNEGRIARKLPEGALPPGSTWDEGRFTRDGAEVRLAGKRLRGRYASVLRH